MLSLLRIFRPIKTTADRASRRFGSWISRNKKRLPFYIPLVLAGWYVYGMFLNSLRRGIDATFQAGSDSVDSIWVFGLFQNLGAVFTSFGLSVSAIIFLLICLITKRGYFWFSGYRYIKDDRGFYILPDGTHGTSGFLAEKELHEFLEAGAISDIRGMLLGKQKRHSADPDKYALYIAHPMRAGDNNNLLCIGAPGSGKSRGFIIPFCWAVFSVGNLFLSRTRKGNYLKGFPITSRKTATM